MKAPTAIGLAGEINISFSQRYRMSPTALRKRSGVPRALDHHTFRLQARQPFGFDALLDFFAVRAIPGVESVDARHYRRTLRVTSPEGRTAQGWIEIRRAPRRTLSTYGIEARMDAQLAPVIARVLAACKHAFDLDCRPDDVAAALGELALARPGLRLPGAFDGFELGVRAILGQQITVKAARTLARRFVQQFGTTIETPFEGVDRLFPAVEAVAQYSPADIGALGIVSQRARAIVALARAVADDALLLTPGTDVERTLDTLRALPGIGEWTAQYIAMRALHWPDAFPISDVAILKAMRESKSAQASARAEAWRPWRSYAVIHLWKSLEETEWPLD